MTCVAVLREKPQNSMYHAGADHNSHSGTCHGLTAFSTVIGKYIPCPELPAADAASVQWGRDAKRDGYAPSNTAKCLTDIQQRGC